MPGAPDSSVLREGEVQPFFLFSFSEQDAVFLNSRQGPDRGDLFTHAIEALFLRGKIFENGHDPALLSEHGPDQCHLLGDLERGSDRSCGLT